MKYTKTGLITEVSKFYKGALDYEKALIIFEVEYGFMPELEETKQMINQEFIDSMDYPESVTAEALTYMKELQESGATNMFAATPFIQNALAYSKQEARELLKVYMTDYDKIYYPENSL